MLVCGTPKDASVHLDPAAITQKNPVTYTSSESLGQLLDDLFPFSAFVIFTSTLLEVRGSTVYGARTGGAFRVCSSCAPPPPSPVFCPLNPPQPTPVSVL